MNGVISLDRAVWTPEWFGVAVAIYREKNEDLATDFSSTKFVQYYYQQK